MFRMTRPSDSTMCKRSSVHSRAPILRDAAVRAVVEHLECRQFLTATLTPTGSTGSSSTVGQNADLKTVDLTSNATLAAAPAIMTSGNVGSLSPSGSTTILEEGVSYNVTAGGPNISGTSDAFRYVYRQQDGDFDVKVQVSSFATSKTTAKAGIMARETLTSGSRHVFSTATAGDGFRLLYRLTSGGDTTTVKTGTPSYPKVWVRLQRQGNTFTAYRSTDGTNWSTTGTVTVALPSTLYLGLATTSTSSGTSVTAQYRNMGDVAPAAPVAPAMPTGLAATVVNSSSIDVTWNAVSGATLYRIQRKAPGESAFTDHQTSATNVLHDTGLTAGGAYSYQVRAENSAGNSAYAASVSQTTPTNDPSASPTVYTGLDINSKPSGSTSLITPGDAYDVTAGGTDIYGSTDSFRFDYAQRTGDFDVRVQVSAISKAAVKSKGGLMVRELLTSGSRTVFSGATNSSGFRFGSRITNNGNFENAYTGGTVSYPNTWVRLKRIGNVFTGYRSTDGVAWTQMGSINIVLPQTLYVGLATASTVSSATTVAKYRNLSDVASQSPVTTATPANLLATSAGTSQINLTWSAVNGATTYRIQRQAPGQSTYTDWSTSNTNSFSDTGLAANSTYSYKVRAENGTIVSAYTAAASAKTDVAPVVPPAVPANLALTPVSSSQINLAWDAVSGATLYRIQRKAPGEIAFTNFATSTTNSYQNIGLAANSPYAYQVRAENGGAFSAYADPKQANTLAPTPPIAPPNFGVLVISTTQIDATWDAVPGTTLYRIQRKGPGETDFTDYRTTTGTVLHDINLQSASTYAYQIRGEDSGTPGDYTAPVEANTGLPAVTGFGAQVISSSEIDLTWNAVSGATFYRIQRQGPGEKAFSNYTTSTTASFADTGLDGGSDYAYQVRAENDEGAVSGYTTPLTRSTPPVPVAPATPTGFTATANSQTQVTLQWAFTSGATLYRVQRQGPSDADFVDFETTTSTSLVDNTVTASQSYSYRVRAENGPSLVSDYTDAKLVTTPAVPPPAVPTGLTVAANGTSQVNVQWSASAGATLYRIQRKGPGDADYVELTSTSNTSFIDFAVSATKTYSYRVRAENGATLVSAYSGSKSVTLPAAAATHVSWKTGTDAPFARQETISIQIGTKLYVWGGFIDQSLNVTNTGYVQDLTTGTWTSVANTPLMQTHAGVATDGTYIYVAGGQTGPKDSDNAHAEVFKYNIATNKWSTFTSLPEKRLGGGLAYLNGYLYFMGGDKSDRLTVSSKTFAIPANESTGWVDTGSVMPDAVDHFSVAVLNDRIYAIGGDTDHGFSYISHDTVRYYNPANNTWTRVASMPTPASHFETGTIVVNGRIVAMGGQAPDVELMKEVRVYDPIADKWTVLENMPAVRKGGIAAYYNGKLYYISGRAETSSGGHVNVKTTYVGTITNPW